MDLARLDMRQGVEVCTIYCASIKPHVKIKRKAFFCDFVSWSFHLYLNSNFRRLFGQCFAALSSLVTTPQLKITPTQLLFKF